MTDAQKAEVDAAASCGITPRETMELMAKQVGGPEHLGFIYDDCKNYLCTKRMTKMELGDTRGDALITNMFWTDAKIKADSSHFGDVDGRPIALLVGVNNHKQTVVFGAALLYDETAITFSWLFDTFASAMSEKKPQTILTDQDKAMAKALASRWPETYHRLCVWHINKNAATHLSSVFAKYKDFANDFSTCIYDYEDEDDFITAWNEMIEKYGLQENEWLTRLFELRKKWALVYGRETFCADMSTTQRSESMNAVIKRYVSYKNDLSEFFEHFERMLKKHRYEETRANFRTSQSRPYMPFPVQILILSIFVRFDKINKI
ncbi:hypothetical protein ACJIZ3_006041 [Penstemon smallii]|uniref:Protein FAR1-RELATED SEQUENCE n=1 Tax=Penstemon smallii TaxID=265156 RepID=A0ABD3S6Q8_9LAMI